jgi:hypothetical protein
MPDAVEAAPWRSAVAHVESLVHGPPLPAGLDVTVHFHPDRSVGEVLLLRHLVTDGVYRSQFETGASNGGLTAHPGGDRWRWEHRMFAGAYDDAPVRQRPVYGSLNHRRRRAGGSVRFGSAHLRLARSVLPRTTFCYPDSYLDPRDFGTATHMPLLELADAAVDVLDDYVEAHVHGGLHIAADVDALVLDPCYRGTDVEAEARDLPCALEWHHGFRLSVDALDRFGPAYRGDDVVLVGRAVAEDGWIDARMIGDAVRAARADPQVLKRLWHCTARFGHDWGRG